MTVRTTLSDWLSYLESMHPTEIDLGLDRIRIVADRLNIDQLAHQVITVAGTNGKGTSCAFLEACALAEGKTVGLYTSPHLIRFNERVRLNGVEASDRQLIDAFIDIENARTCEGEEQVSLTYFEYTTLAALVIFNKTALDLVVLEVGLGGRLDAVNIIDADLALVTSISVDHEAWLGSDIEVIGREKAGVFRSDRPAVYGASGLPNSIKQHASEIGARFFQLDQDYTINVAKEHWQWSSQSNALGSSQFNNLTLPDFPLQNVATCIAGLLSLEWGLTESLINTAIKRAYIRGRMESYSFGDHKGWLDVAHNPDAAQYLAKQLTPKISQGEKLIAIIGSMEDKDIDGVIEALDQVFDLWLSIDLPIPRAISSDSLCSALLKKAQHAVSCRTFDLALGYINERSELHAHKVVVLGSFFTVAEAIQHYEA